MTSNADAADAGDAAASHHADAGTRTSDDGAVAALPQVSTLDGPAPRVRPSSSSSPSPSPRPLGRNRRRPAAALPPRAEVFTGWLGSLFNPWAHWDGVWYIKIATSGYADADGSAAFFPLYPLRCVVWGVLLGGNLRDRRHRHLARLLLPGVWLLYRLVDRDFGPRIAYRTALYLSIFPTAFFWQAVYSESMFLMLSIACLLFAREGRWKLSGLAGLLAALTRSAGFMLLVPHGRAVLRAARLVVAQGRRRGRLAADDP